jgi:hypothetical protein
MSYEAQYANFTLEEYDAWFASFTEKNAEAFAAAGVPIVDFRFVALVLCRQKHPTLIYQPHSNAHHP